MTGYIEPRRRGGEGYSNLLLVLLLLGSIALFVGYWWLVRDKYWSFEARGQFGDMFGGLSALFSAFAFAGIIFVILLQKHELSLQRHQLTLTRDELSSMRMEYVRSSEAQEASAQAVILKEVFDKVDATFQARQLAQQNFELLSNLKNVNDLKDLIKSNEPLSNACHAVVSCYHYIGFLINTNVLQYEKEYFEEASSNVWRMWVCLEMYLKLERELQENEDYGKHFEKLVERIAAHEKRNVAGSKSG